MPANARMHCQISLLLLVICVALCATTDWCARSTGVANWLDDRAQAVYTRNDRAFLRTRNYGDFFETLMLDELPKSDFSRGGAYVFGSSQLVFCAEFNDLPSPERQQVHNFGFPGASPSEIRHLINYLVDQRGWLRAGGPKTAVLLCLSPTDLLDTTDKFNGAGGYFPAYLKGSELFDYDAARGITDARTALWLRAIKLRRNRWRSFVHRVARMAEPVHRLRADPIALRHAAEQASAAGEETGPNEWIALEGLLDDLKARNVNVSLLIMPTGSWYRGLPVYDQFMARLPALAATRDLPLTNCANLLSDDEFMDEHHATAAGAQKVHAVLLNWAFKSLHAEPKAK